jgi:nucleoside-diphosphate-sugar epimerase
MDIKQNDGDDCMNILVTGATGFIGSNLVKRLSQNSGNKIFALVREGADVSRFNNISVIKCDILDKDRLQEAIASIDVIVHLAAVKLHYKDKDVIFSTNVQGTKNLLESSKRVKHFIFASSTLASNPLDPYSESKKECERIIQQSGVNFTILRIAPVFGSGDTTNLTKIIELINDGKTIPIPGDGKQLIQPTHVDDVVDAIESSLMKEEFFGKTCVVAGKPIALSEFINSVSRILHKKTKSLRIPVGLLKPMVKVYQKVSDAPKITVEQLNNLGKVSGENIARSDFPVSQLEISIERTVKSNGSR